jgi:DNA polymerase III subunit epsilon
MLPKNIAFVDIETTGGSLRYDRIIEIGILRVEDNKLVQTYQTLVNPEGYLPAEITRLTGIDAADLDQAPSFSRVKKDILELLDGCVFAAHNARFDYGFLRSEFRREETTFRAKTLCTVKLSRRLFPRFRRHSLDTLIERFGLNCPRRHRALDDARVLWQFYERVLDDFGPEKLAPQIDLVMKKSSAPAGITAEILDKLPESAGVYVFYDAGGLPLYVGKSVNIHDRVLSHFSNDEEVNVSQQVVSIENFPTAGELGAFLLESKLIKKLRPLHNRQLRETKNLVVAKLAPAPDGYKRVVLEEQSEIAVNGLDKILNIFKSRQQAKDFLADLAKKANLCEKLLGLEKTTGACFGYRLGRCSGACVGKEPPGRYNARQALAFMTWQIKSWDFPGPIMIENHVFDRWCYLGTIDEDGENISRDYHFDVDTYKILRRFLRNPQNRKKVKLITVHHPDPVDIN